MVKHVVALNVLRSIGRKMRIREVIDEMAKMGISISYSHVHKTFRWYADNNTIHTKDHMYWA